MVIDAHQHFWNYHPDEYPWMSDAMGALKQDFLPETLSPLLQAEGFHGSVAVQARQSLAETEWLLALSDRYAFIRAVVGWVDLCSPEVGRQLAQLAQFAQHPRFRGVRHVLHDEPDDLFMMRDDFLRGMQMLQGYNLVYDLLIMPRHLATTVRFIEKFPRQVFIIDHIAKPLIKTGVIEPWRTDMTRLAEFPNVFCKVSGMVTEADWEHWSANDFRPYLEAVFEMFGAERVMIGSDWPVCTVAATYQQTMQIVRGYIKRFTQSEQRAILGENAVRIYQIPEL